MAVVLLTCSLMAGASAAQDVDTHKRQQALERYRAGEAALHSEHFEDAVTEFRGALAHDPLLFMAHYGLGQAYMALQRYVEASVAYEECKQAFERINTLTQRDREARQRDNKDEIVELKRSLQDIRSGRLKGIAAEPAIVRIEERIRVLENSNLKGAELAAIPAGVFLSLGSALYRQGRLEDAAREYKLAIKADKKLGAAHNNLAVIHMLSGRFQEARASMAAAEQAGFRVSAQFKHDLDQREAAQKTP
jgi:tetratricopeptide (TPR) repeat protein